MAHGHAQSTQRRCWVRPGRTGPQGSRTSGHSHRDTRAIVRGNRLYIAACVFLGLYLLPVRHPTRECSGHTRTSHDGQPRLEKSKIDKTPQANSRSHRSSAIARFISPRVALGRAACLLLATPCRAATRAIARGGRAPRGRRGRRRGAWRARRPSRRAVPWRRRLG